jgi:hypothetical protein
MKKAYDFSKLKEIKNPYAGKKKAVGINLSPEVVDYFKGLAEETGLPYQKLIDLYLLDCAKKRKKLMMKWVAQWRGAIELGMKACATHTCFPLVKLGEYSLHS